MFKSFLIFLPVCKISTIQCKFVWAKLKYFLGRGIVPPQSLPNWGGGNPTPLGASIIAPSALMFSPTKPENQTPPMGTTYLLALGALEHKDGPGSLHRISI